MALPLILLAVGSVFAGYVGVPHALGGSNRIETFLEPSFEAHSTAARGAAAAVAEAQTAPAAAEAHAAEETHADAGTELMLMALSSGIALAGIGIAVYFWLRNRSAADRMAQSFGGRLPAAARQVLRRRALRRRRSSSRSSCCRPVGCGRASTPA